jgi:hypothetical protein
MYAVSYSKMGIMMKQYRRELENRAWEGEWTRDWRGLYNEQLHDLNSYLNIIWVIE